MSRQNRSTIYLILITALLLTSCQAVLGEPIAQIPGLAETLAVQTMASHTQMAPVKTTPEATPTTMPTNTESPIMAMVESGESTPLDLNSPPTHTPLPSFTPDPSKIPLEDPYALDPNAPCNAAQFIRDVTIPDDTIVKPQEKFTKIWAIRNIGSCTWKRNEYALVKFWGHLMGTNPPVPLQFDVPPGTTSEIAIEMEAPLVPGCWVSNWMLQDGEGNRFGVGPNYKNYFWVQVDVWWPGIKKLTVG